MAAAVSPSCISLSASACCSSAARYSRRPSAPRRIPGAGAEHAASSAAAHTSAASLLIALSLEFQTDEDLIAAIVIARNQQGSVVE